MKSQGASNNDIHDDHENKITPFESSVDTTGDTSNHKIVDGFITVINA